MTRRTRMTLAAALGLVALLLVGCTGIPRSGEVRSGAALPIDDNPAPVFLPSSPQKDMSIEAILRGFVDAASSPENNYAIAREYLAPGFNDSWEPDAGVTVDDGAGRTITVVDAQTMAFSVDPIAEVDASGHYREVNSAVPVPLTYQFAIVDGQWRISGAPNGTVIDENTFSDVFSAQALYFFAPDYRTLIPDLRWFPRGASAPTKIVRAVLAGPSAWLAGAVATAFPEGTKLTADAVQVVGRDAKVDLNNEALNADRVALQRMKVQLTNSLPTGLSVTITIDQNSQEIGELGGAAPIVNPRVDARPLVVRGGELGFLAASGQSLTGVAGISEAVAALKPRAMTLASGQTSAAVLAASGVFRVTAGESPVLVDPRAGLIAPTLDNDGFIWSVPRARPNELIAYSEAGEAVMVPTPWPEATEIAALKVSRDGTRVIAAVRAGTQTRFEVAAIHRSDGAPTGFGEPLVLATPAGVPVDATWVDELTVALLSTLPSGEGRIIVQDIGGVSSVLESPPDGITISGSNSLRDVRVLSAAGGLEVQRGVGWQERIAGVSMLATQQGLGG